MVHFYLHQAIFTWLTQLLLSVNLSWGEEKTDGKSCVRRALVYKTVQHMI